MSKFKVGDKVKLDSDTYGFIIRNKPYDVFKNHYGKLSIFDEDGDELGVDDDFELVGNEISVSRSETFNVTFQGDTHTLTREEAQKLSNELLSSLNEPFQAMEQIDKSVPTEEVVIKSKLPFETGDRYPELPKQIVEFRNEFGDFLQKEDLLAEYIFYFNSKISEVLASHYMSDAFTWSRTRENFDFWDKIDDKWLIILKKLQSDQEGE